MPTCCASRPTGCCNDCKAASSPLGLTPIELNVSFLDFAAARAGLEAPASPDGATMEEQIRQILQAIGEDPNREGLLRTPRRVAQALTFLTRGYDMDPAKVINEAL